MPNLPNGFRHAIQNTHSVLMLAAQVLHRIRLWVRSRTALAAEHLFLQHQLALYQARNAPSRRSMNATRLILVWLSYWFDWRLALAIVQPETFKRWHYQGWRLVWKAPSKPGRPPIPPELQALICRMTRENMTWGQQRIANELLLKLGLRVSSRTVRKYMPNGMDRAPGQRIRAQRWSMFMRNHARALIISGIAADLTRSLQVLAAQLMWLMQCWRGRSVARVLPDPTPHDAASLAQLRDTASGPAVWSPDIVHVLRVDERSPPAIGPTRTYDSRTAARAIPVDTFDVCPAAATLCWRSGVRPHTWGAELLSTGEPQFIPWRRAA